MINIADFNTHKDTESKLNFVDKYFKKKDYDNITIVIHMEILSLKKELEFVLIDNEELLYRIYNLSQEIIYHIDYSTTQNNGGFYNENILRRLYVYALYDNLIYGNNIFLSYENLIHVYNKSILNDIDKFPEDGLLIVESLLFIRDLYKRDDYTLSNTYVLDKPALNKAISVIDSTLFSEEE